jgi:hypothetical protein
MQNNSKSGGAISFSGIRGGRTINNSTFTSNSSDYGGALHLFCIMKM